VASAYRIDAGIDRVKMKTVYIYGLEDPTTDEIRYVGKTTNLKNRYYQHVSNCDDVNHHKKNWIQGLKNKGLKPKLIILEKTDEKRWEKREKYWIKTLLDIGCPLTNISAGGACYPTIIENKKSWDDVIVSYMPENEHEIFKGLSDETKFDICKKTVIKLFDYSWIAIKERGGDPKKEYDRDKQYWAASDYCRKLIKDSV